MTRCNDSNNMRRKVREETWEEIVRDLPEPVPLGKLIGASVILLATVLGSGELPIWPYITTQAGVGLPWLATLGFLSQYFLNMEIER